MVKAILSIILIFLFNVALSTSAFATDVTITCSGTDCDMSPSAGAALFGKFEDLNFDIKPGENIRRTITATNNGGDVCLLTFVNSEVQTQEPSDFSSKLWSVIRDASGDIFGISNGNKATADKTLEDILNGALTNLGTISPNSSRSLEWIITFDPTTGNDYQRARIEFDFDLNFECGNPEVTPTPTPTTTSTPAPTTTPTPGIGGVCTANPPVGPLTLGASTGPGANTVTLSWNAVSPVTHYGIQFGTSSGNYLFGAANIGNTTSYQVSGLTGQTNYFFQVIAFNDCASTNSNEVLGGTVGNPNTPLNPPPPFVPGEIAGIDDSEPEPLLPQAQGAETNGDIAGLADGCCPIIDPSWWIVLLLQTGFIMSYWMKKAFETQSGNWIAFPSGLTLAAVVAHWLLSYHFVEKLGYAEHRFTDWFWVFSVVDTTVLGLLFKWIKKV